MSAASHQHDSWLADLPSRWRELRLKYVASCNDEVLHEGTPETQEIEYVDIGSVSSMGEIGSTETMPFADAPSRARRVVRQGDVLVSTVRTYLKAIAPVRNSPENLIASTGFAVIRGGPDAVSDYLAFALRAEGFIGEVISRSVGISYPAINATDLVNISIPAPPVAEQTQIAKFLDYETLRIDALIEKQQQLIALLKEKRQAVISHAVTKGLNPDAPMRDSGVEWIGAVPSHWGVLATSRISDLTTGGRDTQDAKPDGEYPFFVRSQTVERIDTYSFEGEGVLTSGDGAGVGKIYHHHIGRLEFHQRVYLFHGFRRITGRYFFYFLREHLAIVALAGNAKSTVDSLRRPMLRTFPVCLPPVEEQEAITDYLDETVTRIDALISKQDDFRELLQERRTALISAAVTGKIDVRAWRAPQSKMEEVGA